MKIDEFNQLEVTKAEHELFLCCGSKKWVQALLNQRPFANSNVLLESGQRIWRGLGQEDWLEALQHHPRIGKFEESQDNKADWEETKESAEEEHKGIDMARSAALNRLKILNGLYERRFGYIYLVCASGLTAEELIEILERRLQNSPEDEIENVGIEQWKITEIRLGKLFDLIL